MATSTLARLCVLGCLCLPAGHVAAAGQAKYGAEVKTLKPAALAAARTYAWTDGRRAFDRAIDALIVAAVDRELLARGLTKVPSGTSDITVAYGSLTRTDVDLKTKAPDGIPNEYAVGMLVVDLRVPSTRDLLFRVQALTPIPQGPAGLESAINTAVAAIFQKYPALPKR